MLKVLEVISDNRVVVDATDLFCITIDGEVYDELCEKRHAKIWLRGSSKILGKGRVKATPYLMSERATLEAAVRPLKVKHKPAKFRSAV